MREFKFRVWDRLKMHGPIWIYSHELCFTEFSIESIAMQFTGLKDINGKEIYEGDIVRAVYEMTDAGTGVIKWGGEYPAFDFYDIKTGTATLSDEYNVLSCDQYQFEVIGNIFENPELLESN